MTAGYSAYGGQTRSAYDTSPPGGPVPEFHGAVTIRLAFPLPKP
jgi:hypothetical protein